MALLWIDGFDTYGTSGDPSAHLLRKYLSVTGGAPATVAGRLGGYAIRCSSNFWFETPPLTTNATMIVGFAFKTDLQMSGTILYLYDEDQPGINLRMRSDGELQVYRYSTLLGTTSGKAVSLGTWYYIELKVVCNATTGSYELRINGVNVLSASSVNTKNGTHSYHTSVYLANNLYSQPWYFDDYYICDGSGPANNDFLGSIKVTPIYPNGDTASKDFSRSAGVDNYALVDENPSNGDTDYVESSVSGNTDLYDYQDPSVGTAIFGVQVNTDCRETDANHLSLKMPCKSGVTTDEGSAQLIGSASQVTLRRVLETDPNTGAAWTGAALNSAQFGIKVA